MSNIFGNNSRTFSSRACACPLMMDSDQSGLRDDWRLREGRREVSGGGTSQGAESSRSDYFWIADNTSRIAGCRGSPVRLVGPTAIAANPRPMIDIAEPKLTTH